jgi:hypothetical protein
MKLFSFINVWVTGWKPVESLLDLRQGQEIFLFLKTFRLTLGPTQCPIQLIPYTVSARLKRLGRETEHSDAEVKNAWSYTAFTPYIFITLTGLLLIVTFSYFIKLVFKGKLFLIMFSC